jgi:hypothetical protein
MLRYLELKSGFSGNGPAWIARVSMSRSGTTIYFDGRALKRVRGGGISSNFVDLESGESFWISGVKKDGEDRHWAGSGKVRVERAALGEYLQLRGIEALDPKRYEISDDVKPPDVQRIKELENRYRGQEDDDAA